MGVKVGGIMLEKLPDIWIATDKDGPNSYLFEQEPTFYPHKGLFGGRYLIPSESFNKIVPELHKVRYSAVEVIDCTPKPVPELWVERAESSAMIYQYLDGKRRSTIAFGWMASNGDILKSLPINHKCRIAWDENGIRLIGEPVAM